MRVGGNVARSRAPLSVRREARVWRAAAGRGRRRSGAWATRLPTWRGDPELGFLEVSLAEVKKIITGGIARMRGAQGARVGQAVRILGNLVNRR